MATLVMNGGNAAMMPRALASVSPSCTPLGSRTVKPSASAPARSAARASSSEEIPAICTRTIWLSLSVVRFPLSAFRNGQRKADNGQRSLPYNSRRRSMAKLVPSSRRCRGLNSACRATGARMHEHVGAGNGGLLARGIGIVVAHDHARGAAVGCGLDLYVEVAQPDHRLADDRLHADTLRMAGRVGSQADILRRHAVVAGEDEQRRVEPTAALQDVEHLAQAMIAFFDRRAQPLGVRSVLVARAV